MKKYSIIKKFPKLKLLNTNNNPMNPGYGNLEEYLKYRNIIKKLKSVEVLDGIDINDLKALNSYKNNEENTPTPPA